ncbi:hypothetical protein QTP88_012442 [Uroleucon formosanum]
MIILFWYLVRLLFTAFRKPKPSGGSHAITFGTSTRAGDSLTTLTMKSSNNSDVGSKDYRGGSSSTVGQEDLIPIFLRRLNDLNIRVGTRTRFLIELDDATGVQVRWYHNNVEADSERYQYIHEGGFFCLDIVPVTLFDEGLWVCTAQNYAGKSSTAAHLSLTVPKAFKKPIFVEQLKAVLTQRGIVSLECKVIGVPTPKLRWYKDDKEIKAGDIFALTANSEEDCLGIYTCEATNVMGTALSTSKIQVTHTPLDGNHNADSLIPYGPPPKFAKFLKNASGKVGSALFLECQVEVPPWPRSIGWYNDNGIVNDGPLYHLLADGLGMYGVEIKSLRADHSTTWKCVATSSTGAKAVTSCVVSVSYPKNYRVPRFLESLRAIMTDEGLVSFECKVIGYPTPQLLWFKDGKQLQPGDVYELTGSKSLGSYCCVARNCMGETSSLAELTIEDIQNQLNESEKLQLTSNTQPPRFLLGLKSIEANINESFVFRVKVTTESTPSISWYKEDEQVTETNRYQLSSEGDGTYILNIVPLEIDDQAEWKCVAINKYGQTATSSFLKLNIPKNFKSPRFLEELRIAFSNEGSVNLECKVIGVPQPQLKWFKDGQELNPGDMHKIISGQSGTCCLGTYTCQAHNCMGTVSSSATLLTMEDKSTVKSCASEEYLSVGNPLVRNESLSTIPEERTSQMEKSYTIEEPADISFSFDGKEVTVSLYETPDLTHDEALQIIEMYADELSEHISEDNVVDLPSLRIVKESSISGPVMMEALVIDVPIDFCRQQTVSDTEFDGISLTEDITLENNDKSENICENSLEYFSDHLSSGNSKREVFYSASETTPKNLSVILKQQSGDDGHQSLQTPKLFMSDSDDQILTQLKLDEMHLSQNSRHVTGPLARSESNNTEEEVSETLAEIENEPPLYNYCASEIVTQSDEDGLYSTVLNKIRSKGMASVVLSSEEDDVLKIISRPNVNEFLKYMKIILEGTMVKMRTHENFNFTSTTTELEQSIQALHSLAWKFIEETERNDVSELEKNTADNVSSLMTAINASLLALEQIDDPFGVSDNILNEIQSSVCFDLETLNNDNLPATEILDRLSDQIKNFTIVVNRQVARVTEQRIIAVLQNTIGTTLAYIKTLQQNCSKIKCVDINSLAPLFSMVQPLETILNDIAVIEEASMDDDKPNFKLKQILIPPISSIAFALDNLNTALKNDSSDEDQDLKDIYDRINESTNQFMTLASHGMESNKIAECFISFTKPINDLCCHLRRLGRSTENIVSSDYGSDDKLLLDFETLFDELMIDIDTLINNINFVQDSENNMNPLGSLLEPLQDMKIGLFQVNQVFLSNQTGSTMSYEVISCFEHLSQQLVQLNNCIVNQSIVEETDKEIPFESSIKMMQNILFDDAIDDLGVNGILFGSVMKPLLQLQNIIVSKMASVESDLSFSEHTDVTGGACDTQSLSLSLSNNAQTVLDKTANENSKQVITESSITDGSNKDCDKQNNINKDSFEIEKHSIPFKNNINNDLVIKRGFECDIVETFKCDEPNIITSEDDRENSGFEALFEEIDLETISDFVEDVCLDNIKNSKIDHKPSDLLMSEKYYDTMHKKTDDIIPEHVLEPLEKSNQQDLILNSPVDLFEEIQETLKNMSEVARDSTLEIYDLDNNTSNINDLQKNDLTYINQICDETNNLLDGSLDVEQNIENETFKNKCVSISDQNTCNKEQLFEIGQDVDFVENVECLDSDKSTSNNTVITVNDISDSSEFKMKIIDITNNLETVVDLLESKTGNVSQTVHNVSDKNEPLTTSLHNEVSKMNDNNANMTTSSDFKNESLDSVILNKLNSTESFKNITIHSSEDIIINTNKFNESEKMNTMNNYNDEKNEDAMLIKEVEILSITENVSHKSSPQDDSIVNEIDGIHNLGTDAVIQVTQTRNGNEYYMEKDEQNILINKCTKATELNKVLGILVEEKNVITPENNTLIEDYNFSTIIEDTTNKIKQCDNSDLLNKSICNVEESVIPANGSKSSIVDINLITILADNISKGFIEKQNCENENPSSLINKNNISDTFETNQDVNLNKKLQYDLQPNVNQTLTIDNKQIVPNCTNCENVENPKTELIVLQSEEHDFIKYDENESELINEEPLDNVQQNSLIVKENNILQQSINEEKIVKDLNEKCETLSDIKLKNEIKSISSKIVSPTEIIYPEHHIDVRNTIQQCVLGSTNNIIDDISITQYNVDNKCVDSMLPVIASMTQSFESNVLDKQLVTTNPNVEENQHTDEKSNQNKNIFENSFDSNNIIDDIAVKSKNNVINDFKSSVSSTLNEKATVSDEKSNSENKTTEIEINDVEKPIDKLNESYANLIQSSIFENNNATLSENALINSEIITLSTQSIDPFKFDENHVEIEFKKNIDSRYNHEGVSDDKENKINNLELFKAKNEFIYLPDETINKGEEKSTGEIQHIQNDEIKSIYESASIVVEQITALIDNEMISVSNAQSLDTIVTDFENIKKQEDVEDVIDTAKKNNQQRDVEKASKDKLISKILDTNNLTYDGNKPQKSIKNDYTEIQTSKSIDEKAKSVSNEDAVKKNDDILKTMNNLGTENVEENILTESQLSSKRGVDVYLTENDCVVTTFIDLETTKNNIEKVDNLKILASEINYLQVDNDQIVDLSDTKNDLAIHKCSFFVKENTEDCYEITSNSNTCIEISNENNANQHKQFTECKSKVMGNFETLERLSDQETLKTNTVNNEEKFNRNEDNLETNKTDDQNRIEYNTDKEQSPIIIDICKSLENNKFQINDKNQICLCDTKLENVNEKLREILEYNQDISDNNFEKSSDFKNNLGGTENLKNHEINSAEIQEEFINLKDLEVSKIVLETITDNTPKVEYNESKNQIKSSSFKNPPELVTDELNISSEIPNSECLFINKNVDGVNIESSNSNNSVTETLQINAKVDIIDQHTDISKTVTQDSADIRKDKSNATKDYPDHNQRRENTLPISEVRENQERNTINDNKEKEHSNITPDSINIHEDKLINEVKISDEINVVTALENKGSLLNDFIFQSEISDLSTKESFSILSIMPKLHCVEKIAANGTECVMLENTNILKQDELNATESVKQHAQVERELNIAAIGNIIMDYDSIKENSLTTLDEKKCIEKASITSTFDNNSFEIVSTNVNILDGPIKDMTIKEEQIAYSDTDEVSKISKKFTTLLSENKNPVDMAIHLLNDQIQNTDNLVQENINDKIALTNKTTGTLETNDHNQNNLNLNKEQSELADKLQQSIKNQNQIFESSIISVEKNDTMDKVKSDILITKVATTKDKKTIDTEDIVDINRKLSNESKKSETPNIGLSGNEIDTNTFINETIDQSTKEPSLGSNNTEKVEVKFCNLDPEIDSENNKNPEVINEISKDNQINLVENVSEDDKTKRGSKKKKSSLEPKIKKSPSPETTKSNISGSESNIDKIKVIDKSIEENNKILSDNGVDTQNVGVSLDKIRPEIISYNNKVPDEIIEKDASNVDKNENQKKKEIGTDDEIKPTEKVAEDDKTKRGSKKKKSSPEPKVKKSPSPETTKSNISGSESNIDKIKVIDKSIEENNKILSDNGVDTQNVGVSLDKIRPEIIPDNNKVPDEIIEKDASNVDKNENHKKNEIGTDDEIEPTENVAEDYKTKRGSKKKKSSLEPKVKKSPSPETTKINISGSESNIDKIKVIDKSIEENNKILSDNGVDTQNVGVSLDKIRPEIIPDNNKVPDEIIDKDASNVDKNENQKKNEIGTDDEIKPTEKVAEDDKTKRGSKKKKSSPEPKVKKSPSPETTKSNVSGSESNIDKIKVIDKSIEENNKILSDNGVDTQNVGVSLDKIRPEIIPDNNKVPDEIIDKDASNVDKNENQKKNEIGTDDEIKPTEKVAEDDKTKRGSKKKKSSLEPKVKKSPSPETTKSNVSGSESNIDKIKVIDKSIEENNKILSDNGVDSQIVGVSLDKIRPEIIPDNNKVPDEIIDKDASNVDKNENHKKNEIGTDDEIKPTENVAGDDKTKRGSKKKKSSLEPIVKKSPSPETTKSNISGSESNIDKIKVIDKSIEENNKILSDNGVDTQNVGVSLDKIRPEIIPDNNKVPDEIIEKDASNVNKNENHKKNEIGTDDEIKPTENVAGDDKTKRGSKKKKSSLEPIVKKSPSPETTKINISGSESNIDKIKVIDKSIEENNKILSDNGVDTQNVGVSLDKIRPEIIPDNNKVPDEIIEKDASNVDKNENHKKNEIGTDDEIKPTEKVAEDDKTKRGSKKKKSSLEPIVKKSPSPETTKINISGSESNIDKIKVIDKSIEENNKILSDNGVDTQNVGVSLDKIRPEIIPDNNKVPDEIIEKDASNVDKNENHKKNEIGTDDEIEPTENVAEDYKTKRGSKKKKSSLEPKDKKSTLPNKINKKTNKKLEINNEIEKKENSISDLTENFIEQLPDGNIVLDKMEKEHATQSLEDNYIDIGKSKININDTHLLTNIDKCVVDNDKKERGSIKQETSTKSHSLEKTVRTDTINENVGVKPKDNTINCLTSNKKVQNLSGMTECDVIDVPEIRSLDKRPVNRYLLDVTDAHKSRPNSLAYRSLTPDPLTSYRSLTPDHMSSYRSLTPECPSYRSSLTPRSKYPTSAKYAGSSGRELYGGSSSTHSSRSSSRSTSPYPPESRISTRSLWPTSVAAYRCLSETSIPLSPRRMEVETTSDWPHTSYGVTTRRRRGSDSFLHDSGVRDGGYYSSWRLSDGRAAIYSANEDLYRTKEAFKGLHFCVRMIDQTVSSGARVKFWCSVIGHPEPRVQWYRDGQKLNSFTYNSSARYQTKYDGGLAQLIVENAQSGDSGEYTCVASNARDRISTTGFLTVYTSPSVFRKPLLQPSLSVDGIESGRGLYSWTSNDFRLSANDKFDFGCQKFGNGLANRRPEYPKFVSSIIADDVATYGGTIALQVRVQGSPVPNVTWMRESKPLPRLSNKYVYLDEGGLYTLLVMDSTAADGGKYVCRACNLYGVADTEKAVRVVSPQDYTDRRGVKPAIIVSRPNDRLNVAVGEDITVTLRVAGEPKPKVIWMRGSRDVTFLDRSLKETVNDYVMLSIKKAQPSDAGTYFIIAKNVYGSDRAFVTVGVSDRISSWVSPNSSR